LGGALGLAVWRAIGTFAVAIGESLNTQERGALVSAERTGKYPPFVVRYVLGTVELPEPIDVSYGITLYRVEYRTIRHDGSADVASGLVALPNGRGANSVVMYLHGTSAERREAPSEPGLGEGTFVAAAAAGSGHVFVAPDYLGLGTSREAHPYMHAKTTASTCVDFLIAARTLVEHLGGEWPTSLYVMGFSQGGHAALTVGRELEALEDPRFQVKAVASIAGPFYLREVSFPQALTGKAKSHPFYLAYVANSYAHLYGQPLESLLEPPYVEKVPNLFDGEHESEAIAAALPTNPRELFNSEFLEAYDNSGSHWFLEALAENNADDWKPRAPVRLYYGETDVDVSPEEARRAEAAMRERGANVAAISVGPHDHEASALRGIPRSIRWFTESAAREPAR
jgi:pimeloyl-ACP methyl ester carboxylesterase